MKTTLLIIMLYAGLSYASQAQSESYRILSKKFASEKSVTAFKTSGFVARTVLWLAGEKEFNRAIKKLKSVRVMTIPKTAFQKLDVSVGGFKNVLQKDDFEQLLLVREDAEEICIYQQSFNDNRPVRYFFLIDNPAELVAVEIRGQVNIDLL